MTSGFEVWEHVFSEYPVIDEIERVGVFSISSAELNKLSKPLGGPDARNLVKYDHQRLLPPVLRKHKLSILPVARGQFVVGDFRIYAQLDDSEIPDVKKFRVASHLDSLKKLSSETDALTIAWHGGVINSFLGEEVVYVGGGKDSGQGFDMTVSFENPYAEHKTIHVDKGVSIEIDGLYEGPNVIAAFEAKMKPVVDFNIRQLFYPYRALRPRTSKNVKTVFLTYWNEIFDIREFEFRDPMSISSFQEVARNRYTLAQSSISMSELVALASRKSENRPVLDYPLPQADKLDKVLSLAEMLTQQTMSKEDISEAFGFHLRQSDYYANAAGFLGLARRTDRGLWGSTPLAEEAFSKDFRNRNILLAGLILSQETVRFVFLELAKHGQMPKNEFILEKFLETGESGGLSGSTLPRRINTVKGWAKWLSEIATN